MGGRGIGGNLKILYFFKVIVIEIIKSKVYDFRNFKIWKIKVISKCNFRIFKISQFFCKVPFSPRLIIPKEKTIAPFRCKAKLHPKGTMMSYDDPTRFFE